jgi:hypothetical protein
MSFDDLLPREEPGKPLIHIPPGSVDKLMQRIADYRRAERRRRLLVKVLIALCLVAIVAGVYVLRSH